MKTIITVILLFLVPQISTANKVKSQIVHIQVTKNGFEPKSIDVKAGVPVILKVVRKTDITCAKQIQIPSMNVKKTLHLNKEVTINIGKLEKGEIRFGCTMDMMESGNIIVK